MNNTETGSFWGTKNPTETESILVIEFSRPGCDYLGAEIPFVGGMYLQMVNKYGQVVSSPFISSLTWTSWESMIERMNTEVEAFGFAPVGGIWWRNHQH